MATNLKTHDQHVAYDPTARGVYSGNKIMAEIASNSLVEHLECAGFVGMEGFYS
jgi:hypothetical protein